MVRSGRADSAYLALSYVSVCESSVAFFLSFGVFLPFFLFLSFFLSFFISFFISFFLSFFIHLLICVLKVYCISMFL